MSDNRGVCLLPLVAYKNDVPRNTLAPARAEDVMPVVRQSQRTSRRPGDLRPGRSIELAHPRA